MAQTTGTTTAIAMILTLTATVHGGSVLYVDDDAPPGGDGTSWKTAYRFLQDALADASQGGANQIRVAQGVYQPDRTEATPDGTGDREAAFQLLNDLALMGGYAGIGADDPDERDIDLYETTLSGDLLGDDGDDFQNNDENSYHVVIGSAAVEAGMLDGFTISGGNADGVGGTPSRGGGAFIPDASPIFLSCTFSSNFARQSGGAVWSVGDIAPSFEDCVFTGNMAFQAGAVSISASGQDTNSASFLNCLFSNNTTTYLQFSSSAGGAIGIGGHVTATFTQCTFLGNTATGGGAFSVSSTAELLLVDCILQENYARFGGAIRGEHCTITLNSCTLSDNTSINGGAVGLSFGGMVLAANCSFLANTASSNGGAVYVRGGAVEMTDCLVVDNAAEMFGGGIFIDDSDLRSTFVGCIIQSNGGDFGGGLFVREAEVALFNSKLLGNIAQIWGGGLYTAFSNIDLTNCSLSGNLADNGGAMYNFQTSPVLTSCTFSANNASQDGGGVFNQLQAHPSITNCVLWGNTDSGPTDESAQIFNLFESDAVVNYSCVQGLTGDLGGIGNIGDDPLFVDPDGKDDIPGTEDDDLRLQIDSPAIDAAFNNAVPADVADLDDDDDTDEFTPLDLDRNPRFADAPDVPDTGCGVPVIVDMGAYELIGNAIQPRLGDTDGDLIVGVIDLLVLLSTWGPCDGCCLADFDADGLVGASDLPILLANWGPSP